MFSLLKNAAEGFRRITTQWFLRVMGRTPPQPQCGQRSGLNLLLFDNDPPTHLVLHWCQSAEINDMLHAITIGRGELAIHHV